MYDPEIPHAGEDDYNPWEFVNWLLDFTLTIQIQIQDPQIQIQKS